MLAKVMKYSISYTVKGAHSVYLYCTGSLVEKRCAELILRHNLLGHNSTITRACLCIQWSSKKECFSKRGSTCLLSIHCTEPNQVLPSLNYIVTALKYKTSAMEMFV